MTVIYKNIKVCIKSIDGKCPVNHQVGETFHIKNHRIISEGEDGLCLYALSAMIPYFTAYYRDTPEGDWINNKKELQCPDSKNTVIFEIERY